MGKEEDEVTPIWISAANGDAEIVKLLAKESIKQLTEENKRLTNTCAILESKMRADLEKHEGSTQTTENYNVKKFQIWKMILSFILFGFTVFVSGLLTKFNLCD